MPSPTRHLFPTVIALIAAMLLPLAARAQEREQPGHSIGKVSILGHLILMELDRGALGEQNLFNLDQRTLRFTPDGSGYRVEVLPLHWDADFGDQIKNPNVPLRSFSFPFSGKTWDSLSVGVTGSIRFGPPAPPAFGEGPPPGFTPRDFGGVSIARFDQLSEGAGNLVNTVPAICVFFKPRMSGDRYAKELDDRVVVTWDLTEPWGNIQDFTWTKTVNQFQAVLHKDGVIEMSYKQLAAKDAIIGVYPLVSGGSEESLATLAAPSANSSAPANLNLTSLRLSVVDGLFLKVTFETAGPVLPEGDPNLSGIAYRVHFGARPSSAASAAAAAPATADWTVFGFAPRRANSTRGSRYVAFGPGVSRHVATSGNTISIQGLLPSLFRNGREITVSADTASSSDNSQHTVAEVPAKPVSLTGLRNPEVHFSSLKPNAGPFPVVYEAFHYYALPNNRDLSCTVIKALGDKYDFLLYYSDFRVDNQEAGTPSDGPLGSTGPAVTGIGTEQTPQGLASYCTPGRFQWAFVQPVYSGAIQAQEYPPADAPVGDSHDITFYQKQLAEISQDGKMPPYMYAMSQVGHELGHRWAASLAAKVGDETIQLGDPYHWLMGVQAIAPFPYVRPTEASIMGGGVWQDNFDGTYTQLDDNYYVPATGYSYLDLYAMGLISPAEVPDFFLLRNFKPAGTDANGHRVFKADRTKITIQDIIAAEGPRTPDVDHSQRKFNTGMVIIVQHGLKPSERLINETNGIREQWMKFFSITTGRRASVTTNPD
ncbi:MAG TPA: hypothetical protein VGS59_10350 [Candidatus Acidoferrales bacterium]|nr:hypothetical protein [Candidatus Acidoferrales bacterium]